jgi:hypothetical protein
LAGGWREGVLPLPCALCRPDSFFVVAEAMPSQKKMQTAAAES